MRRSSLSLLLLLWILPTAIAALSIATAGAYYVAKHQILKVVRKQVNLLEQNVADQISGFFIQRNNDIATISQSPLFRDYFKNKDYNLAEEAESYHREIELMLLDFSKRAKVYPRIRYINAKGINRSVIRDGIIVRGKGIADDVDLAALRGLRPRERLVSNLIDVDWHPYPIVQFSTPLFDDSGRFRGALVFDCSMSTAFQLLGRSRLGTYGNTYLLDPAGKGYPQPPQPDENSLVSSAPAPGTKWTVKLVVDRSEFLRDLNLMRVASGILLLILSIGMVLIVTSRVRSATEPIQQLAQAANSYAKGILSARVPITEPQEVAVLAVAFNAMADHLEQRTKDLENRVRELTALQRMNGAVMKQLGRREIGRACLEAAVTGLGFERGVLYWVEESKGEIAGECVYGAESVGLNDDLLRRRRLPIDSDNIWAQVYRTREVVVVDDAASDPRLDHPYAESAKLKSVCYAPIVGRNNRVIGIIGVDNQLTGQPIHRTEANRLALFCSIAGLALENAQLMDAIIHSEIKYRSTVENSPDAIVALDQNFRISLWNRRAEGLFGHQPTEAFGRTMEFLFDPGDYQKLLRKIDTEGAVRHLEAAGVTRDGRKLDLIVSWTGQKADHGGAKEWFVVMQDITEKKQLQSQLLQAEKMSAVGTLIAGVAHELNNPLAAVTGYSEILISQSILSAEVKEDLRQIHRNAFRCRDIVRGLLVFSRNQPSDRQRVPLNRLVQDTLSLVEYSLRNKEDVRVELDLCPKGPAVAGEYQKFQQVLVNLINNAVDALKERPARGLIRIETHTLPDRVELRVDDNGPGVPPESRKRLFDPFFTTKRPEKGTGLGLTISSQIVTEFGGALRCEESPLGGASFVASLPHCPKDLPESETLTQLPPPVAGRRALVVDDEPNVAQMIQRILKDDGVDAAATTRYDEALGRIESGRFDLIVADVGLGAEKGTDLIPFARKLARPPAFLFVSGDVLNPNLHAELALLQAPLLSKPFLRTDFLRMVRNILAKAKPLNA